MRLEPCGTDVLDALSISHMSPVGHDVVCSIEIFFSITPLHQTDARAVQVFAIPRPSMQFPLFLRCSFSQISYSFAVSLRLDGKSNLQDDDGIQKIQSACHLSSSIKVTGRKKNRPFRLPAKRSKHLSISRRAQIPSFNLLQHSNQTDQSRAGASASQRAPTANRGSKRCRKPPNQLKIRTRLIINQVSAASDASLLLTAHAVQKARKDLPRQTVLRSRLSSLSKRSQIVVHLFVLATTGWMAKGKTASKFSRGIHDPSHHS
ncbi:uncharacterized protein IWZ02DRAFT_63076 [Phyllosticta citriasiana]|uniref:uncharacterized protein n=1 Tax=Phyllosticta citriasiana TaxID=595635 RepID=UPI0030FD38E3